jgi:hypothetical membrane protein
MRDDDAPDIKAGANAITSVTNKIWALETSRRSFAQIAKVQYHQRFPNPKHLTWEAASSYMRVGATAYRMLMGWEAHTVPRGDVVLVRGPTGGLVVMALQVVKAEGGIPIDMIAAGEVDPVLSRVFPFEGVRDAHEEKFMVERFARPSIFAAVGLFWCVLFTFAALYPGYSHYNRAISELGAFGAPHQLAWNLVGFIAPGLLLAIGGAGVAMAIDGRRSALWWMLIASGIGFAGTGILPAEMHHGSPLMRSPWTIGHVLMTFVSGIPWVVAAFMLASHVKRHSSLQHLSVLSRIWSVLALVSLVFNPISPAIPFFSDKPGLAQRIAFAAYFGWFLAIGLMFLTVHRKTRQQNA